MLTHCFDDEWFLKYRARLLRPEQSLPKDQGELRTRLQSRFVQGLRQHSRVRGAVEKDTESTLSHLAPRHATATRAHMQFYRSCLESTGLVPSDKLVNAAVQVEWLWYTTPFKGFYRDHLAHVMKVALTALWLLEDQHSPLAEGNTPALDVIAERLARGSNATLVEAALWCGNTLKEIQQEAFWSYAIVEAVRLAGLLHDLAYPDVMSTKVGKAALATHGRILFEQTPQTIAKQAIVWLAPHMVMNPFRQGRMAGPLSLEDPAREVAERLFLTSHSLRGAHTLLSFMEDSHRAMPLTPREAFVMEWAALAISLHDYDKLFECATKDEAGLGPEQRDYRGWLLKGQRENLEAIRPRFDTDPVSYMVALADQLQDFGRMSYQVAPAERDRSSRRVHYPCTAVELTTTPGAKLRKSKVHFILGGASKLPFGATEDDAKLVRKSKRPGDEHEPIFGPKGWLNHAGLFEAVEVELTPKEPPASRP